MSETTPTEIKLLQKSKRLSVTFDDGQQFDYTCEYLRVFSPSAEVRGHGQRVLVDGKSQVNIISIEPVGNYAVKLHFDDGHNTGLYSWKTLYELGQNHEANWQQYLSELSNASLSRKPNLSRFGGE